MMSRIPFAFAVCTLLGSALLASPAQADDEAERLVDKLIGDYLWGVCLGKDMGPAAYPGPGGMVGVFGGPWGGAGVQVWVGKPLPGEWGRVYAFGTVCNSPPCVLTNTCPETCVVLSGLTGICTDPHDVPVLGYLTVLTPMEQAVFPGLGAIVEPSTDPKERGLRVWHGPAEERAVGQWYLYGTGFL